MKFEPTGAAGSEPEESADLRALYRQLQPRPLAEDVDAADPETERVVQWMRGAWSELEAPAPILPAGRLRPRRRRWMRPVTLAAAAVLLLAAGATLWWRSLPPNALPDGPAAVAQAPAPPEPRLPAPVAPPETPVEIPVEILDVRADQLELRSGPVRLVLLDPPAETEVPPGN